MSNTIMIDPDNLKCSQIEAKLKLKQFTLIKNIKGNCEKWLNDISLVGRINENDAKEIFEGYAALISFPQSLANYRPVLFVLNNDLCSVIIFVHTNIIGSKYL